MHSLLDINLLYDMPGSGKFWLINFAIFFFYKCTVQTLQNPGYV